MTRTIEAVSASKDMHVYSAPPASTLDFPDGDTVEYGEDWDGDWEEEGYTTDGFRVTISMDFDELFVDQLTDPILMPVSGREIHGIVRLAQHTPENLKVGLGVGIVTDTAPTVSTKGVKSFKLGPDLTVAERAWGFDNKNARTGEPYRGIIWRGLPMADNESVFGISGEYPTVNVDVRALPDDTTSPARVMEFREYSPMSTA